MKHPVLYLALLSCLVISSCGSNEGKGSASWKSNLTGSTGNGIYYWKTVFKLDDKDSLFLKQQEISRMYLRLFDVDVETNYGTEAQEVNPVGTLKFESKVPDWMEMIPTVFITVHALKMYDGEEEELARLITKRMMAICSYNGVEGVNEFQFDCDWTESTREQYERLCEAAKEILHPKGIALSGTIRLHQVEEAVYPFDRGVLMLYNTGAIKDPETKNSIISFEDVNRYLGVKSRVEKFNKARKRNCPVVDCAYPTFCWGVCYDGTGRFDCIIHSLEFDNLPWLEKREDLYYVKKMGNYDNGRLFFEGQFIRPEYSDIKEILKVKDLVDKTVRQKKSGNIIFHLDQENLSKYNADEISEILR